MKQHLGLAAKKCVPCEAGTAKALTDVEVNSIRNQTPGWQVIKNAQGHQCLRQQWKVKNFKAGLEMFDRIGKIAEQEGHHPDLHLEGYNTIAADLSTHSVGEFLNEISFCTSVSNSAYGWSSLLLSHFAVMLVTQQCWRPVSVIDMFFGMQVG